MSSFDPEFDAGSHLYPAADRMLEQLLAALPLRQPSAMLDARLEASVRSHRWFRGTLARTLASAAVVAAALGFVGGLALGRVQGVDQARRGTSVSRAGLNLVPLESTFTPLGVSDPQTTTVGDAGAVHTVKARLLRTDRYLDPARNVTIERTYPEELLMLGSPAAD